LASITRASTKKGGWRLSYRDPITGKWRQKTLHCSKEQAEAVRKKLEAEYNFYNTNPLAPPPLQAVPVSEATKVFLQSKAQSVRAGSHERYDNVLTLFLEFSGRATTLEINNAFIEKFKLWVSQRKYKLKYTYTKNGINTILRHLRVFIYWLNDNNYIRERVKVVMIKTQRQPITVLSRKEYKDLIQKAGEISPLLVDIIEALILTGARANELLEATWNDYHGNYIQLTNDKSGESGKLIINQRCREVIERQTGEKNIFGVDYWWLKRNWKKLDSEFTPHDLRRTAGAWLLQNGVSIFKVSKFLRHSSVVVTENYYVDILRGDYDEMARLLGEIV